VQVEFASASDGDSTMTLYHDGIKVGSKTADFSNAVSGVTFDVGGGVTVSIDVSTAAFDANETANVGEFYVVQAGDTVLGSSVNAEDALLSTSDASDFSTYMDGLQTALDTVSNEISKVGALMGRLGFKEEQVAISQVNVEASYNRIMNADMAFEQLEATKFSILQQTSTTMLAQANTAPQGILGLFR
jgi:flagellin